MRFDQTAINPPPYPAIKIDLRTAYHQAGRAVAICLGNQQKQLPSVYFHITIKAQEAKRQQANRNHPKQGNYTASIEGGRLIQSLPLSFAEAVRCASIPEQAQYRCAFEADVTNLLAGPLAEAKYAALRDNSVFNANLVYLRALDFYGVDSDKELINEYLACLIPTKAERKQKLAELFLAAYSFINQRSYWSAICALAEYILARKKTDPEGIIQCEDVSALLEAHFSDSSCLHLPHLPGFFARR